MPTIRNWGLSQGSVLGRLLLAFGYLFAKSTLDQCFSSFLRRGPWDRDSNADAARPFEIKFYFRKVEGFAYNYFHFRRILFFQPGQAIYLVKNPERNFTDKTMLIYLQFRTFGNKN